MSTLDPFEDYKASMMTFNGDLVHIPDAPTPRPNGELRRRIRDFLLDEGGVEDGWCGRCQIGQKFQFPAKGRYSYINDEGIRASRPNRKAVCVVCDRPDLWPNFQKAA